MVPFHPATKGLGKGTTTRSDSAEKARETLLSNGLEQILGAANIESAALLQIQDLDHSIFGINRVPPRPHSQTHRLIAQIQLAPNRPSEIAIPVTQQQNLIPDLQILLPRLHHEGVVDGDTRNGIHALRLELCGLLHESREVLLRAGGRERAGNGDEDGLLVGGEVGDRYGLELVGGVEIGQRGVR